MLVCIILYWCLVQIVEIVPCSEEDYHEENAQGDRIWGWKEMHQGCKDREEVEGDKEESEEGEGRREEG